MNKYDLIVEKVKIAIDNFSDIRKRMMNIKNKSHQNEYIDEINHILQNITKIKILLKKLKYHAKHPLVSRIFGRPKYRENTRILNNTMDETDIKNHILETINTIDEVIADLQVMKNVYDWLSNNRFKSYFKIPQNLYAKDVYYTPKKKTIVSFLYKKDINKELIEFETLL